MSELGGLSIWRHGLVAAAVAGCCTLAATGLIGEPARDERFESKQIVVTPAGGDGVRITEVVDFDFGSERRHGYQRRVRNDLGVPEDIVASSPDAPDVVAAFDEGDETLIRIGDPDLTVTGQHRYVVSYTLPDARLSAGELAIDIIDTDETFETERFEVVVAGFELEDRRCDVGSTGTSGGCELQGQPDGTYRTVIEPLEPGQGITVGGTITSTSAEPIAVAPPAPPPPITTARLPLAVSMVPLGLAAGGAVYFWSRRRGRNEVFAGGAADAAYGPSPLAPGTPLPPPPRAGPRAGDPVRLVADERLAELATIEFVPPKGVDPWLGAVLLRERIDNETVGAWFSGLAARDVLTIDRDDDDDDRARLRKGPELDSASAEERAILDPLFEGGDEITLGRYDKEFADAWREVRTTQADVVGRSGLWRSGAPRASSVGGRGWSVLIVLAAWVVIGAGSLVTSVLGWMSTPIAAVAFGIVVPALVALAAYRTLWPVRSATGSALALRAESFRRFLAASEGRHVEWAWKQGLLREYSAWAVALGAASAWERAMAASSVPPAELTTGPLLVYSLGPSFTSGHTAPSSSGGGGGGGGGFSGGVGGGGGGGSSGSW